MVSARRLLLAICGLWLALAQSAIAAPDPGFRVFRIGNMDVAYADEILAGRHDAHAIAWPGSTITPTVRAGGWWRLDARRDWPRDPRTVLVLDAPIGSIAAAWLPGSTAPLIHSTIGTDSDAAYGPRLNVFELPDGLRAGEHIYLYVKAVARSPDTLQIMDEHTLRVRDRRDLQINTLIHGTLLALVLVGIGLGLILRESDFLLLGFGLGFSLLFLLDNTGELYRIPWLIPLAGIHSVQRVMGSAAAIFTTLFIMRYLQVPQRAPLLARIQRGTIAVQAVVLATCFIPGIGEWPQWSMLGNFAILTSSVVGLLAAVKGALAGDRPSRMFLWSWLPLLFLLSWRVLEVNLGWPANELLHFAFPASWVLAGILLMVGLGDRMLQYKRERDASDLLARRDPLTEVDNRRALNERLHAAAFDAGKRAQPLALLFVDLDHFKRVNDEHGHDVGDECLREVARRMRNTLHFGDMLGRYSGEEFVIGLPQMQAAEAAAMAERIRLAVGSRPIACDGIAIELTISIGVAVLHDGLAGFDEAIKRADRALYISKRAGRDRVSVLSA